MRFPASGSGVFIAQRNGLAVDVKDKRNICPKMRPIDPPGKLGGMIPCARDYFVAIARCFRGVLAPKRRGSCRFTLKLDFAKSGAATKATISKPCRGLDVRCAEKAAVSSWWWRRYDGVKAAPLVMPVVFHFKRGIR
jgi:hypothetical protein